MKLRRFLACLPFALLAPLIATAQTFTEVSATAGIHHMYRSQMKMGGGAAWFDMDRDGDEDLVMSGGLEGVGLFRNEGNGQFTEVTYAAGLGFFDSVQTMGVVTGDIDNDGYREIFFTTAPGEPNYLLYNLGNGTFSDITFSSGIGADTSFSTSAMFFDADHDRLLDLYVGNYVLSQTVIYDSGGTAIGFDPVCLPNYYYHNDGNLHFTEMAVAAGLADSACALAVTNTNLQPHTYMNTVVVANDFGMWHIPNQAYVEQSPGGSYLEQSQSLGMDVGMYGMGFAQADYDHDRDIDYYITDIGPNKLMHRMPGVLPQFRDTATTAGVQNGILQGLNTTGWGTAFLDIDNDSWEDLYACNGHITVLPFIANALRDPDKLYYNNGDGTFTDITVTSGIQDSGMGRGMIRGDYDLDGDEDILTMVIHWDTASGEHTKLWRNQLINGNHWINLRLEGTTWSPRDPFGAVVEIITPTGSWVHEVSGGGSHMSQNSSIIHVGLGASATYDAWVHWPNGGIQPLLGGPIDTTFTLLEDTALFVGTRPPISLRPTIALHPNPTLGHANLELDHPVDGLVSLEIWDMQGRCIWRQDQGWIPAGHQRWKLDEAHFPSAGTYLLRVLTETGQASRLLLRQ